MKDEQEIKNLVGLVQTSPSLEFRKTCIEKIQKKLKPFRFALAKKFANKGVDFDDVVQQIELKLIEAIYDYDETKDPSALRHITSRTRNGIWNYYRKEMNYFDDKRKAIHIDDLCFDISDIVFDEFDEDVIIKKLTIEEELGKLTPHQKEVLLMYFVDDKTQYNIAEELNINQANVSRAKKRAINQLRANISDPKPSDVSRDKPRIDG